jgi:hypothetical protein
MQMLKFSNFLIHTYFTNLIIFIKNSLVLNHHLNFIIKERKTFIFKILSQISFYYLIKENYYFI